jgi:uncharacterized membrane protein
MLAAWLATHGTDWAALLFHVGSFAAYGLAQNKRARRNPNATLQRQQAAVRSAWVDEVVTSGNGILGVQTLRNTTTAALFFASNTVVLVFGVLTFASQGRMSETFGGFSEADETAPELAQLKLLLLLLTLLAAFFCFISAIRMFSHASISIGLKNIDPKRVTRLLEAAWRYQARGVRGYYFAAPLLCWLFGAPWLLLADLAALALMHAFDNATP